MRKIVLYNPSITSLNLGDMIIFDSISSLLAPLLRDNYIVDVSTHLPINKTFQTLLKDADYKFVCGTNLLRNKMEGRFRQWDINIFSARMIAPVVLIGVGWQKDYNRIPITPYTKTVYSFVLDHNKLHSVRDNYTKEKLKEIGITNVVNTGCPTIWGLTEQKCKLIPKTKAKKVVFTLTDYNRDTKIDKHIILYLKKYYKEVALWIQGYDDYNYARDLGVINDVKIIPPDLKQYDQYLDDNDVEYIGTRLHGGIRALQRGRRSLILAVDDRAQEKKKDFNLPVIRRADITDEVLMDCIEKERETKIKTPIEAIERWKRSYGLAN